MKSREKLTRALNHQDGPVPVDFGGTAVTGMHVSCVAALREHYGLEKHPVTVIEPYQMLGWVEDDLKTAMRSSLMRAGPELQISNMVPRPIDLGLIPAFADDAMDTLNRMPVIKALFGWLIFLTILTYLFWMTR